MRAVCISAIAVAIAAGCSSSSEPVAPSSVEVAADAGAACPEASHEEVSVSNTHGALHGTLEVPAGCGPFRVVVLLPGSGGTNRDGSGADGDGPEMYRMIATDLAARGIATLRYDKAGVAASADAFPAREEDFRFEMGATDAALWVPLMRGDARFSKVMLAGHSEGSLLAMLVAQTVPVDGFVSLAGAGRPIGIVLREQLTRNIADEALRQTAFDIVAKLEKGELVADVPKSLAALFRPSVQPYLISWMAHDPAADITRFTTPTLLVQGTTDIQVAIVDAEKLAAARPDATLAIFQGMNHVLKDASLDRASQNAAYTDPKLPLSPGLVDALELFVLR